MNAPLKQQSQTDRAFAEAERRIAQAERGKTGTLSLVALGLTQLPESIGNLTWLQTLYLQDNSLGRLPESIGRLDQLQGLSIDHNKLTELPESIGQLAQLSSLFLSGNELAKLPDSIGRLAQLHAINLAGNHLTGLPESIGRLALLQGLSLAGNRLTRLPEGLLHLVALQELYLHDNPALKIPPEELGPTRQEVGDGKALPRPPQKILNYYFRTQKLEKRPLNEAKLILVGRGGAGKTSLRKRLLTGEFDEGEDKTKGIQVTPWPLSLASEQVKLNVWDFGGQENMLATHGFFLTKRSLYVLVLNAREGKQETNVENWLRLIGGYGGGSPALVVVNKCNQHPFDLAEQTLLQKFPFIRAFLWTDCKTEQGLVELRAAIERETAALPDLRTPFPTAWFALKEKLEGLPKDCITYDDYRDICDANDEKDEGNQQLLIGFLHDLGTVLYFHDDTRLNDLGVLKPTWVTEGIYGLLNAQELKAAGGVLDRSRLGALLSGERWPSHRHDFLLRLMEKFDLCFDLPQTTRFLIPELLPEEPETLPAWPADGTLGFEYQYNVLPEGLLPRFIVRTHTLSTAGPRWRSGVVLRQAGAEALVRADVQDRRVWIAVRGPGRQPRDLLAVVRSHFEELHRDISGLTAQERVPVPGYPGVKLDYRKLLVREANGKTTVEFETETESIEQPLRKLLENFEDRPSRVERAQIIVQHGGKLIMPNENYDFSGARIINSVVGAHMQNITNAIQQLPEHGDLRAELEALQKQALPLLEQLPRETADNAAQDLEDFTKEAAKEKPRKSFLEVTSQGLIEATTTVAALSGPIIETVNRLKGLIGF